MLDNTTPIQNFNLGEQWFDEAMELTSRQLRPLSNPEDHHKKQLGNHTETFTSEYRFKIWSNEKLGWQVFVNNKKGACFEVKSNFSGEQAQQAWNDYFSRMVS